jgi:hypothetical protein
MPAAGVRDYASVGLNFARALARRDYTTAYAMTSSEYRRSTTIHEMLLAFEAIIPPDWRTVGPVEWVTPWRLGPTSNPRMSDGAYVSIGGDVYSEAVTGRRAGGGRAEDPHG